MHPTSSKKVPLVTSPLHVTCPPNVVSSIEKPYQHIEPYRSRQPNQPTSHSLHTLLNHVLLVFTRMASSEPKGFAPKNPVQLDPPKDDPISVEDLAKCDGTSPHLASTQSLLGTNELIAQKGNSSTYPTYVAIKGTVFDVSGNSAYGPNGSYHGTSAAPAPPQLHP